MRFRIIYGFAALFASAAFVPPLPVAVIPMAHAQGPAGCYDPERVSGERRRLLDQWGTPQCPKSSSQQRASNQSAGGAPSWSGDINGAHAHALEDKAVILMAGCGETDDDVATLQLGVIEARDKAGVRNALMGGEPSRGLHLAVEGIGKTGSFSFATAPGRDAYGGSLIDEKSASHAGGSVRSADLRALMRATVIRVRVGGRSFTFPVRDSAKAIGALSCSRP